MGLRCYFIFDQIKRNESFRKQSFDDKSELVSFAGEPSIFIALFLLDLIALVIASQTHMSRGARSSGSGCSGGSFSSLNAVWSSHASFCLTNRNRTCR